MTPAAQTRTILLDATVLATLVADALHNLDLGLAGWPTTTPGASPSEAQGAQECPHRDCSQTIPCPAHGGDDPVDIARRDLEDLTEAIRKASHHLGTAASVASRWAYQGIDDTTVKARLVAIDSEIWCANCVRYGRHEPRKRGKEHCDFCDGFAERKFKRTNGDTPPREVGVYTLPPKEIWDARDARNGRLDETTIARILKAVDIQRRLDNIARKAREKADREAAKLVEAG